MSDTTSTDQMDPRDADQQDQTDQTTDATTGDDDLGDKGHAALKAERDARKKAERDLKALRAELDTLKNAGKSESEQIEARLKAAEDKATAAELRLRAAYGENAVTRAASKAGAIEPSAIYELVDHELEYGDDDKPINVDEALASAKKRYPALFRAAAGSGDGGKGGSVPNRNDINSVLRDMARSI